MMTQRERLASGYLYTDMDEGMPEERLRGKMLAYEFNHTSPAETRETRGVDPPDDGPRRE